MPAKRRSTRPGSTSIPCGAVPVPSLAQLAQGGQGPAPFPTLELRPGVLAAQRDAMAAAVAEFFPKGTRATRPDGGYFMWLELPPSVDALALHRLALRKGISVDTLTKYFAEELVSGKAKANSQVGRTLFQKATGGDTGALILFAISGEALLAVAYLGGVLVLLGGVQTLTGPVVGAVSFTWLQDTVARSTDYWRALLGAIILLLVLAFPQGIAGFVGQLFERRSFRGGGGPSAGPLPSRPAIPSGDRPTYPSGEGST